MKKTNKIMFVLGLGALASCGGGERALDDESAQQYTGITSINTDVNLPKEYKFSNDLKRLEMGGFYTSEFYDDSQLEDVYLEFSQEDYLQQLSDNYEQKIEIEATLTYKGEIYHGVGVRYRGLTSYAMSGDKKSFSIDLEWLNEGQDIDGYNEIKLNNAAEDPSAMREVLYSKLARHNIPSAKANFVNLFVNGENYGIYSNVQKLEKDHAKEWFFDKELTRWRAESEDSSFSIPGGGGFPSGGEITDGSECTQEQIDSGTCEMPIMGGGFPESIDCTQEQIMNNECDIDVTIGGQRPGFTCTEDQIANGECEIPCLQDLDEEGNCPSIDVGGQPGFGGGFGAGSSSLNDLGETGEFYEDFYTLKYSSIDDPWQYLANACHTLGNQTSEDFLEELGHYMDIDATLWFLATENIFGDDDSYINKGGMDYYVYFDLVTNRILPIEYDGNSALKQTNYDPFKNVEDANFPLLNVLLNIPELRQRYLAHYRTIMEESLDPENANTIIDDYLALIDSKQAAEAVRNYSYDEFLSGVTSLRNFFDLRLNYLVGNEELSRQGLEILAVNSSLEGDSSRRPLASEKVSVEVSLESNAVAYGVNLYYGEGLTGMFTKVAMSRVEGSDIYRGEIPAFSEGKYVRYYVEAIADDGVYTASYSPAGAEHDVYIYQVQSSQAIASDIVINELMPANKSTIQDSQGNYSDWIELFNNSSDDLSLGGYYLTDKEDDLEKWSFPDGTIIEAKSSLIVWANDSEGGSGTSLHANFKLSADGERLFLLTPELEIADQVLFGEAGDDTSYARTPNGTGDFQWTSSPSFDDVNP